MPKKKRHSKGGYAVKLGRATKRFKLKSAARRAMKAHRARGGKVGSIRHVKRLNSNKGGRRSHRKAGRRSHRVRSNTARRRSARRRSKR